MFSYTLKRVACSRLKTLTAIVASLLVAILATVVSSTTRTRKGSRASAQFRVVFGKWEMRMTIRDLAHVSSRLSQSATMPITDQPSLSTEIISGQTGLPVPVASSSDDPRGRQFEPWAFEPSK